MFAERALTDRAKWIKQGKLFKFSLQGKHREFDNFWGVQKTTGGILSGRVTENVVTENAAAGHI